MAKNAALEGSLGGLHALIAKVLTEQCGKTVENEEGELMYVAPHQLIAVAAKFLKDNEITATREQSEEVAELEDEIAARRKTNDERAARTLAARREAMNKIK